MLRVTGCQIVWASPPLESYSDHCRHVYLANQILLKSKQVVHQLYIATSHRCIHGCELSVIPAHIHLPHPRLETCYKKWTYSNALLRIVIPYFYTSISEAKFCFSGLVCSPKIARNVVTFSPILMLTALYTLFLWHYIISITLHAFVDLRRFPVLIF